MAMSTLWLAILLLLAVLLFLVMRLRRAARVSPAMSNWIVVDGGNVMYWQAGGASIIPVRDVVTKLHGIGHDVGVVFDAEACQSLTGQPHHNGSLSDTLGLSEARILVVESDTPAAQAILKIAHDLQARIVSNDKFRAFAQAYPDTVATTRLITGGYTGGALYLAL